MPLETLARLEPNTADGVLAAAVLGIGNTTLEPIPERYKVDAQALIDEAKIKLSITRDPMSREDLERIRSLLAEEVTRRLTAGSDMVGIGFRLGSEGKLPLGAYKIVSSDTFKDENESVKFAIQCVRHNDGFEHIYSSSANKENQQNSIFCKMVLNQKKSDKYWVLVITGRKGDTLTLSEMYRLFPETVTIRDSSSPILMFEDFLKVYGEEIRMNGRVVGRGLLRNFIVPNSDGAFSLEIPRDHANRFTVLPIGSPLFEQFVYAYGVNMQKYSSDRRKFG